MRNAIISGYNRLAFVLNLIVLGLFGSYILILEPNILAGTMDTMSILLIIFTLMCAFEFSYWAARSGVSAITLFYFFQIIFMGVTPLMSHSSGRWLFGNMESSGLGAVYKVLVLNYVFAIIISVTYRFQLYKCRVRTSCESIRIEVLSASNSFPLLLFGAVFFVIFAVLAGSDVMFYRDGLMDNPLGGNVMPLILGNVVRPAIFFAAIFLLVSNYKNGGWGVSALIGSIFALLANWPVSLSRNYLFSLMIPLYFLFIKRISFERFLVIPLLLLGIVGSVFSDQLRFLRENGLSRVFNFVPDLGYFYAGHFDAFEVFVYGVKYVDDYSVTWGRQLLGCFLFWFPRSFWADKPVGTGQFLGEGYIDILKATMNTNLSAPLQLEFYINFGGLFVVVGAILLAFIMARIDGTILAEERLPHKLRAFSYFTILPTLLGVFYFACRGDMLNSFAFTSGFTLAYCMTFALVKLRFKLYKPNKVK